MVALMNSTESGQPKHMSSQTKPFREKGRRRQGDYVGLLEILKEKTGSSLFRI